MAPWRALRGPIQLHSALEIFSSCTIIRPPTILQVFANFWPKQHFITPCTCRCISAILFSLHKVENEVKRTPFCGCCWDPRSCKWWMKEGPKREFLAAFQKLFDRTKACIYANGAYFEFKKKVCVFLVCLRFLKKSVLKLLDSTVYTGCFMTCGHYCRRWFPRSLWSKKFI